MTSRDRVRMFSRGAVAVAGFLALFALTACEPRMKMLTDKHYAPRSPLQQIELYQTGVATPHEDLALIDSVKVEQLTTETRKALVNDLRERARRVGADAVIEVAMLIAPDRNYVVDPQTPFRSYRQGWSDLYFLRGRAIRYKPSLIETDSAIGGEEFGYAEGERPALKPQPQAELDVRQGQDSLGRPVWTGKRKETKPKVPSLEEAR